MSFKGKKRRMDPACLTCAHGRVCYRMGKGRCHDYIDSERFREIPPCGETRIWWIAEDRLNGGVFVEDPHVVEETVDVEAWGYDAAGRLFAVTDKEIIFVGTQNLYFDAASAEVALRTGAWRETV